VRVPVSPSLGRERDAKGDVLGAENFIARCDCGYGGQEGSMEYPQRVAVATKQWQQRHAGEYFDALGDLEIPRPLTKPYAILNWCWH
jgi:hypothetical protein